MNDEFPERYLFNPQLFQAQEGCHWQAVDPGGRMNEHYIAAPAAGEDREVWLAGLKTYRDRVRTGDVERYVAVYFDGERAWIRTALPVAALLKLAAGDRIWVTVSARWHEGNNVLCTAFDYCAPGTGAWEGWSVAADTLEIPKDGQWHDVDAECEVPKDAPAGVLVRPIFGMDGTHDKTPGRVDVRSITIGLDGLDRMMALSRYLRAVVRPGVQRCLYDRADLNWAASAFTGHFTFMWDRSFYDPDKGYTIDRFLADGKAAFGGYDTVVLWQAYPRIGTDPRNQFDFYRDMPGGLEGLLGVVGKLHENGVKAFVAYNPWDTGTRREGKRDEVALAEIVQAIDADGVYLDTLGETSPTMRHALDNVKPGVVIGTELHPPQEQLSLCSTSWAQWLQDPIPPGMPHLKWIEPRHMQQQIRRWDTGHTGEIETAFFNGAGMVVWENVFSAHNPWDPESRALWKRAVPILRAFAVEFTSDAWDPFVRTAQQDMYAHRWPGKGLTVFTLFNTGAALRGAELLVCDFPEGATAGGLRVVDLWNRKEATFEVLPSGKVAVNGDIDRLGCIALAQNGDSRIDALLAEPLPATEMDARGAKSVVEPRPIPRTSPANTPPAGMVAVPGGAVRMKLTHQRRECGCYPDPGTPVEKEHEFLWGSPHDGMLIHDYTVEVKPFLIDEAQVTNAEFKAFLEATDYAPKHPENFLKHWPEGKMPEELADHPVVYVDLEDARAYAAWCGKRLPAEPEWQAAAQGNDGREWPWGNVFEAAKCNPGGATLPVRALPEGRSPVGCYGMSGNVWEWTESERDDGHTRFAILRGGSWFKAAGSGWYMPGGPQPCTSHAKFLLLWPGLDRCSTIGFRCVKDQF